MDIINSLGVGFSMLLILNKFDNRAARQHYSPDLVEIFIDASLRKT